MTDKLHMLLQQLSLSIRGQPHVKSVELIHLAQPSPLRIRTALPVASTTAVHKHTVIVDDPISIATTSTIKTAPTTTTTTTKPHSEHSSTHQTRQPHTLPKRIRNRPGKIMVPQVRVHNSRLQEIEILTNVNPQYRRQNPQAI